MTSKDLSWLPHLENAVPPSGYGNRLSMYLIALEAWRRGISVKFFWLKNPENKMLIRYILSYKGKEHYFESSMGDKLSDEAFRICENKDETKKYLENAGIPVPKGKMFRANAKNEDILKYAQSLGYPLVIKPRSENAGKGVVANIQNEDALKNALFHVKYDLGYGDVIVEQYIPGIEYRILMVNEEIVGAVNRMPANVVGDGEHSIKELINIKNKSRKNNPNIASKTIKLDNEVLDSIHALNYNLDSVPKDGERILLRKKSNVSMGGDPIDVTDQLTDELKEIALKAVRAIPNLGVCGLDMIVDEKKKTGSIIEINTKPMIGLHMFPVKGKARDVVKPIVDYYFPETKEKERSLLYFDFNAALAPIRNHITNHIEVSPPSPRTKLVGKKFIVSIKNESEVNYRSWVRFKALEKGFHGYVKKIADEKVEIVIVGSDEYDVNHFKNICLTGPKNAVIDDVTISDWYKPVKIGFEIQKQSLEEANKKLKREIKNVQSKYKKLIQKNRKLTKEKNTTKENNSKLKKQLRKSKQKIERYVKANQELNNQMTMIEHERDQIKRSYDKILQSRSWRYTKFFRTLLSKLKK